MKGLCSQHSRGGKGAKATRGTQKTATSQQHHATGLDNTLLFIGAAFISAAFISTGANVAEPFSKLGIFIPPPGALAGRIFFAALGLILWLPVLWDRYLARIAGWLHGRSKNQAELADLVRFVSVVKKAPRESMGVAPSEVKDQRYLPRPESDKWLRTALRTQSFVVVVGDSAAGKSRAAGEAARQVCPDHRLVVPAENLQPTSLGRIVELVASPRSPLLLWLDNLEQYLAASALTQDMLIRWAGKKPRVTVLATMESEQWGNWLHPSDQRPEAQDSDRLPEAGVGPAQVSQQAAAVLSRATRIDLPRLLETEAEREEATRRYGDHDWTASGLGEVLAAGPQMLGMLRDGEKTHPHGYAIATAAAVWRHVGVGRPINRVELRGLSSLYLPQWASLTEDFERGLEWITAAIKPGSKIRILSPRFSAQGEEHFEIHDYVAAALGGSARLLSKKAWAWILQCKSISAEELERISATAYARGELTAVIEVCDHVVERYDQALEPDLRLHVARALLSKGITLGAQGRPAAAIEVLDEVVDRYVRAPEPELREQAARALLSKAITLGGQGQPAAAIEVLDEVVDRYVRAPEPELREQAARALLGKGMMLGEQGQPEAAIEVLDELVDRYGAAPEPQLHAQVVRAQLGSGLLKAAGSMFIRQHWIALVNGLWLPALTGLVLLFIIYALSNLMGNQFRGDVQLLGTLIILLVWGAWAIVVYLQWASRLATVTGQHVILEYGVFARDRKLIALDQVQDITVAQSLLGRMLKYGVLEIDVAGQKGAEMLGYWRSPELLRLGAHVV